MKHLNVFLDIVDALTNPFRGMQSRLSSVLQQVILDHAPQELQHFTSGSDECININVVGVSQAKGSCLIAISGAPDETLHVTRHPFTCTYKAPGISKQLFPAVSEDICEDPATEITLQLMRLCAEHGVTIHTNVADRRIVEITRPRAMFEEVSAAQYRPHDRVCVLSFERVTATMVEQPYYPDIGSMT